MVLTRDEVRAVLQRLDGVSRLMALRLYGAGLRLLECGQLRVKDIDFATNQIVIRDGKGREDRVTMLPAAVRAALIAHLERAREQYQANLRHGAGWVELPNALTRKYPNAGRDWGISCSASRCITASERRRALQGRVNAGADLARPCPLVVLSRTTLPDMAVQDTERSPHRQSTEGAD